MTAIHQGQVDQWKSQKTGQRRAVSSVVRCFDGLWLRDCSTARGRALPCFSESTGHPASKPHGPAAAESTAQLRPLHTESQADRSLWPRPQQARFLSDLEAMTWRHKQDLTCFPFVFLPAAEAAIFSFSLCTQCYSLPTTAQSETHLGTLLGHEVAE